MARLRHANGSTVTVPDAKVEHLLRAGFRTVEAEAKEKPAPRRATKKAAPAADDES